MATTPPLTGSTLRVEAQPLIEPAAVSLPAPKVQPLWRFALVGLGPLTALGIFALLVALLQHMR